jgi:predicted nucleotidyltransferase component of viral defense system
MDYSRRFCENDISMSGNYYKDELYPFQDDVLAILGKVDTPFYLTGGTAFSRCYLYHRYSDDLDFFQNNSSSFDNDVNLSIELLKTHFLIKPAIRDVGFYRIIASKPNANVQLKIEWINDVNFHSGEVTPQPLFPKVNSYLNMLSNKVCALSREAAKDVADLIFLSLTYQFSWKDVVNDARHKDTWLNEIAVSQILYDFDSTRLKSILWIDATNTSRDFSPELKIIARDLLHGFDNSLVKH